MVGESGAGKSLTGASIIGLLDSPGQITGGEIRFDGRRIDNLPYDEMRKVRGRSIGAIFQDPLTSLDPPYTVGQQLIETIQTHLSLGGVEARRDGNPRCPHANDRWRSERPKLLALDGGRVACHAVEERRI